MSESVAQAVAVAMAAGAQWMEGDDDWLKGSGEVCVVPTFPVTSTQRFSLLDEARAAVDAIAWFSYRKDFELRVPCAAPRADGGGKERRVTTDRGWGCVHRCGQMLLCTALGRHLTVPPRPSLLPLFRDHPDAVFSLQQIALAGEAVGFPVGQWFSPSAIARVLRTLVDGQNSPRGICADRPLRVVVAEGESGWAVRVDEVHAAARAGAAVLLMVPVRLGLDSVNPQAVPPLQAALSSRYSVGVVGGRPGHSLYFCGYRGTSLCCLDPHTVQPAFLDVSDRAVMDTFCDRRHHSVPVAAVDPSLVIGFYVRDPAEVDALYAELMAANQLSDYPIFSLLESGQQVDGTFDVEPLDSDLPCGTEVDDDDWVCIA
eukprot:TRINITY_DN26816_c0_g1_i1.p1 TRINITY_DN26816_c0_g1~~TRINITY_DN26816_c0_g1_i1.p1  ORF type:complete len:388 (+),score=86.85 TRINITY_DN26816_c0_g1_i1:50-1165(+)